MWPAYRNTWHSTSIYKSLGPTAHWSYSLWLPLCSAAQLMYRTKTFPSETYTIRHIVMIPNVLGCCTINYCYYDDHGNYVDHITASVARKSYQITLLNIIRRAHSNIMYCCSVTRHSICGHVKIRDYTRDCWLYKWFIMFLFFFYQIYV